MKHSNFLPIAILLILASACYSQQTSLPDTGQSKAGKDDWEILSGDAIPYGDAKVTMADAGLERRTIHSLPHLS